MNMRIKSAPAEVFAVDPEAAQIEYARRQSSLANFRIADGCALPFSESTFDIVVSALVMNFISDRPQALSEMQRVVRPGGVVGGYVWDFTAEASPSWPLRRALHESNIQIPSMPGALSSSLDALGLLFAQGGLNEFAIPISTPGFDNGPYITAGHWITKDPETGKRNVGNYRGLIKGPGLSGLMSGTPQDLSTHWEKCRKRGIPLEVAIVVGTVPAVSYAATQKVPPEVDELALAGGLMGEPVKLVKCQTIDVEVPNTSEIVLEGIIPTNYMEEEGPFGESMGYVDPRTLSTVFELKCVTHRKNPIWVSIISQVTPSESSKIKAMGMATLVKRFLVNRGLDSVREVHLMDPLVNLRPYVVVSLKKRNDQEPWDAMQGVLDYGDRVGKLIVAVDEDINPRDPIAVTWAITHRSQPHKDIKVVGDRPFGATPIGMVATHPSSRYDNCESSLLIDATRKADFPPLSLPKKEYMVRAREIWEELGLPKLEPQEPWHGYLMGLWPDDLAQEADLAAQSEHEKVWEKLRQTRVQVGEGETMKSMRAKWGFNSGLLSGVLNLSCS
jgi:4-hydroxy-3-polyprenylbenzoate decarboxylase